ncbi:MAG: RusA family crossover junction endodeoxyribonuclease [Dialister invisus]|uniref:RusA family crossover junction endodeoxyribonuclease n=1 Tax=Dialister invisus TaxID=218538 RepID=UPI00399A813D
MEFIVEGEPQGKARPRGSADGAAQFIHQQKQQSMKNRSKLLLAAGGEMFPIDSYVSVTVNAYFSIPKSYMKGKRLACKHNISRPAKKPDIDNILKAVLDALNGVAYEDDKQVIEVTCRKWYSAECRLFKDMCNRNKNLIFTEVDRSCRKEIKRRKYNIILPISLVLNI